MDDINHDISLSYLFTEIVYIKLSIYFKILSVNFNKVSKRT